MAPRLRSVLGHVGALLAGMFAGGCGSFLQAARADVATLAVNYGVAVALALTALVIVACGVVLGARSGALAAVLGWVGVVTFMLVPRAEGDLVFADSGAVYVWLYAGTLTAAATLLLPYPRIAARLRPPPDPDPATSSPTASAPAPRPAPGPAPVDKTR